MQKRLPAIILPGTGVPRELKCPVIQSPLAGITDQIFRSLVRRWAPDALLFTEMVNATSLGLGHGSMKVEELSRDNGPIGVQIFDHRPNAMVLAARYAEASGAFIVDINMGCPVRKITKKGGGSGLLKDPDLAVEIVKKVSESVKIPVSVKTRLGWCQNSSRPIEFALRLQDAGAQLLTVHGRTREQGFQGKSDWQAIAKIKRALSIPVIANGDIYSANDAFKCLEITKADGIMIGRGSMGAPWLVGQIYSELQGQSKIKDPSPKERIGLALEQLEKLLEVKGKHGLLIAKKHLNWTCKGFEGASELRKALMKEHEPEKAIRLLKNSLSSLP